MKTLELKTIKITDDFPLYITFNGKASYKLDTNGKLEIESLLNRNIENSTSLAISNVGFNPSLHKNKILEILHFFFKACNASLSPQGLWSTDDCNYRSLILDFDITETDFFEQVYLEMIKRCPELTQEENFVVEIPEKDKLKDFVSQIEVAYPETWTVEYTVNKEI